MMDLISEEMFDSTKCFQPQKHWKQKWHTAERIPLPRPNRPIYIQSSCTNMHQLVDNSPPNMPDFIHQDPWIISLESVNMFWILKISSKTIPGSIPNLNGLLIVPCPNPSTMDFSWCLFQILQTDKHKNKQGQKHNPITRVITISIM